MWLEVGRNLREEDLWRKERKRQSPSQDWSRRHKGIPGRDNVGGGVIAAIVLNMELRVRKVLDVALCIVVATITINVHPMAFHLDADELGRAKKGMQDGGVPKVTRPDILYGPTG